MLQSKSRVHGRSRRGELGLSLVEIMVVVGISAILAAIGIPKYASFMAVARQSEAKNNLAHLYMLEQNYLNEADVFGNLDEQGPEGACTGEAGYDDTQANQVIHNQIFFKLAPCHTSTYSDKVRYTYRAKVGTNPEQFLGEAYTGNSSATNKVSGCATRDAWMIDHNKNIGAGDDATIAVVGAPDIGGKDTSKTCP